jgi:hypothetical protein
VRPLALLTLSVPSLVTLLFAAGCPSQECNDYVRCQKAYDDSVDVARYENGGACWSTLQGSQLCTAQCKEALAALADVPAAPPECTVD